MQRTASYEDTITNIKNRIPELIKRAQRIYDKLTRESLFSPTSRLIENLINTIDDIIYYTETIDKITYEKDQELLYQTLSEEIAKKIYLSTIDRRAKTIRMIILLEETIKNHKNNPALSGLIFSLETIKLKEQTKLDFLNYQIKRYESKPDLTDGEIDLYIDGYQDNPQFRCSIYLHNIPIEIGSLEYRGPNNLPWLGDIGYNIYPRFQGHNYAYKALNLVKKKISSYGIDSVIITTHDDNIPSQRTIEKFGGQRVTCDINHVYRYRCELTLNLESSKRF